MADKFSFAEEHARFAAPVITKVTFYAPQKGSNINQSKNAAHIGYIGTRTGVDVGEEEKAFNPEDITLKDRVAAWAKGESVVPDTAAWHVKYADERPGSHGLFSSSDESPKLKDVQKELLEHKGIVWRTVVSLKEEDALRLGYTDRGKWEDALRATVPDAAAKMGIPETNLRWVAAFHQEPGHPHVHLVFWEKNPVRRKGVVNPKQLENINRTFAKEIFADERMLMNQEKTAARELIRNLSKDELGNVVNLMREVKDLGHEIETELRSMGSGQVGIAPRLYTNDQKEVMNQIKIIGEMIPDKGRVAYQYMPEDVKQAVQSTTRWFLKRPAFQESLNRYYGAVEGMTRQYSFKDSDIRQAKDNAAADLEKRVSQVVLRAAVESKKKVYTTVDPERAQIVIDQFSKAMGRPEDDFSQRVLAKVVDSLRQVGLPITEQLQLASNWVKKADLGIPLTELRGIIQNVNQAAPLELEKTTQVAANAMKLAGYSDQKVKEHFEAVGLDMPNLKESGKTLKDSVQKVSEGEWTKLTDAMGIKAEYPWEMRKEQVVVSEVEEIVRNFREGKISGSTEDQQSKGYTAYCMTVALKQLGVGDLERKEIMTEFAKNNSVEGIGRILKSIAGAETNFLKDETWKKINDAINTEMTYPWRIQESLQVNPEKYQEAIKAFELSDKKVDSNADWVAQKYATVLKEGTSDEQAITQKVREWAERTRSMSKDDVNPNDLFEKRTEDIRVLGRQLKEQDEVQKTVSNFAKVMFAAGLKYEEVVKMITDWNQRSGLNLSQDRLDPIIDRVNKEVEDLKPWGRAPVVNKRDYENLKQTLNVEAPYLWQNNKDRARGQSNGQDPSMNLAKSLWKTVWNSMEQERIRSQAQGEMMKKQNEKRLQREAEQEQE
ncbi:MobP3 family relaxase [Paenibacillus taichungensis]|uniref:MobP3 family relaxase n=1 Tax=Paenibacillus taichungensis TaxID=484184 RepID=UPI0035D64199